MIIILLSVCSLIIGLAALASDDNVGRDNGSLDMQMQQQIQQQQQMHQQAIQAHYQFERQQQMDQQQMDQQQFDQMDNMFF